MIGHFKMKETGPFRRFARAINEQARVVKAATVRSSHNVRVSRTSNGTYLVPMVKAAAAEEGTSIVKAVVLEVGEEWLKVRKFTDTTAMFPLYVAKPQNLRKAITTGRTWQGWSITVSATDSQQRRLSKSVLRNSGASATVGIDEFVDPPYTPETTVGDPPSLSEVWIAETETPTGVTDPDGDPINWIDINIDARAWVRQLSHYRFCLSGADLDGAVSGGVAT